MVIFKSNYIYIALATTLHIMVTSSIPKIFVNQPPLIGLVKGNLKRYYDFSNKYESASYTI